MSRRRLNWLWSGLVAVVVLLVLASRPSAVHPERAPSGPTRLIQAQPLPVQLSLPGDWVAGEVGGQRLHFPADSVRFHRVSGLAEVIITQVPEASTGGDPTPFAVSWVAAVEDHLREGLPEAQLAELTSAAAPPLFTEAWSVEGRGRFPEQQAEQGIVRYWCGTSADGQVYQVISFAAVDLTDEVDAVVNSLAALPR